MSTEPKAHSPLPNQEKIEAIRRAVKHHDELVAALEEIKEMTDADNNECYRCDDREGCLDAVFAKAQSILAKVKEGR